MPDEICPHCKGTGYVIVERDGLSAARRCSCAAVTTAQALWSHAGIPENYAKDSFENFRIPQRQDNPIAHDLMARAFMDVKAFARDFPATEKPGLLLVGETGSGKTHLAVAVMRALIGRGHEAIFWDYQHLLDRIRSSYDPASGASDREAYQEALECEVLLLDDLGAHRVTEWVEDTVTSIITYRCNHNKPMIATTNLTDPEMAPKETTRTADGAPKYDLRTTLAERIGARARSRLFEMCRIVRMPRAGDYRVQTARM